MTASYTVSSACILWVDQWKKGKKKKEKENKNHLLSVGSFLNGRVKKKSNRFWEIFHLACRVNHSRQLETDILSTRLVSNKSFSH